MGIDYDFYDFDEYDDENEAIIRENDEKEENETDPKKGCVGHEDQKKTPVSDYINQQSKMTNK